MSSAAQKLIQVYEQAEKRLVKIILSKTNHGSPAIYERQLLRQIAVEVKRLRGATAPIVEQVVMDGWRSGTQGLIDDLKQAGVSLPWNSFSVLNRGQIELLVSNAVDGMDRALNLVGRRLNDEIRDIGVRVSADRTASGMTVRKMQKELERRLYSTSEVRQSGGLIGVRYRNGRIAPLDTYSKMAARTITAEAQNKAKFSQAADLGYGLVRCTAHSPTCEICAKYQNRVYALTREFAEGKLKGPDGEPLFFPYLYDTALVHGYETIHPNCIHRFVVLPHRAYRREEVARWSRDSQKPFKDARSDAERKAYLGEQVKNRLRNQDYRQWQKYKALLPSDTPNFGAFRNMKKWDSEKWQELQKDFRYIQRQMDDNPPPEQLKLRL